MQNNTTIYEQINPINAKLLFLNFGKNLILFSTNISVPQTIQSIRNAGTNEKR